MREGEMAKGRNRKKTAEDRKKKRERKGYL